MPPKIKNLSPISALVNTTTFKHLRHWIIRNYGKRDRFTLTRFYRSPTQYEALTGPIMEFLSKSGNTKSKLKITCIGCSNGSEAYTIASILHGTIPDNEYEIFAYDIDEELIEKAKKATYTKDEVMKNPFITKDFVQSTFNVSGDIYTIKPEVQEKVTFEVKNVLDKDLNQLGGFDIVFAQNMLVNMKPKMASNAFHNICRLLKKRSVLFIDGMDLGLRSKLTKANHLSPLDYKIEKIYEEVKVFLGEWPYWYSGLEPFSSSRSDKIRRYSTIFIKES